MKIFISNEGEKELQRLKINIHEAIEKLLAHVPDRDLIQLSHILVTDFPEKKLTRLQGARGAYYRKWNKQPARIEIYLKNIFGDTNPNFIKYFFPMAEFELAQVLFHEIGHHVEKTRSHGINKTNNEFHADQYAGKLLPSLVLENGDSIRNCFQFLESNRERLKLDKDALLTMKTKWEKEYQRVLGQKESL